MFRGIFQHEVDCHKLQSKVEKWKTDGKLLQESIDKGNRLTSRVLHKHGYVLLRPEILDLAQKKIEAKTKEKNNRIISLMKRFYEIQYKYSLIMEKYNLLTNEIIYGLSTGELKDVIYYFAKGDITAIPARKIDII